MISFSSDSIDTQFSAESYLSTLPITEQFEIGSYLCNDIYSWNDSDCPFDSLK